MDTGRLLLTDGSTTSCEYDLGEGGHGTLRVPGLLFTAHGSTIHDATLELADASRKRITVTMGPRVGEAEFSVAE